MLNFSRLPTSVIPRLECAPCELFLQVSIDVAWSPECIDLRCYDYAALVDAADLSFVMAYDERSQVFDECIAWANSASNNTYHGEWA